MSLIEQFMLRFDARSQHAIEVRAPAQAVFTAVEGVTVKEVRFLRELEFIRALPRLATTGRLGVAAGDAPLVLGFTQGAVLLGARPPQEILAGAIGCFWRFAGNEPVVFDSAEQFESFTEPGFAKAVVGFRLDPNGAGILLTTQTRFVATDDATRRLMSLYWRIIRPGSNIIRKEWLRAIRRRALCHPQAPVESGVPRAWSAARIGGSSDEIAGTSSAGDHEPS